MINKLKAVARETFTVRNIFFLAGIGCLGSGLWLQSPSLALTTLGALFLGVWIIAFWATARGKG